MTDYPILEHDVLVIGAGGAGLRAAIEASGAGVSVGATVGGTIVASTIFPLQSSPTRISASSGSLSQEFPFGR